MPDSGEVRALELNYETIALNEDEEAINKLKLMIHEDMDRSDEITLNEWIKRPAVQKLAENFSRSRDQRKLLLRKSPRSLVIEQAT